MRADSSASILDCRVEDIIKFEASEEELSKIDRLTKKNILAIQSSKNIDKIKKSMEVLKRKGIEFVLRNDDLFIVGIPARDFDTNFFKEVLKNGG